MYKADMRLILFGGKERYDSELGLLLFALSAEQPEMSTAMLNTLRADLMKVLFMLNALLTGQLGLLTIAITGRIAMKLQHEPRNESQG